jgi:hypothetical protein
LDANGETVTAGLADAVPTVDTVPRGCALGDALLLGAGVVDETRPLERGDVAQPARRKSAATAIEDADFGLMLL